MDSISQAVLGGCIQGGLLGKQQGRKAYLYGALLGTLPDLDVLIRYENPIDAMTYHRGFSHSIFTLTLVSLLIVVCLRLKKRAPNISFSRLFLAIWLALITHPILDSFTNYGTQLFWPLQVTPLSLASVFIIDPFFTLPLLCAFVVGLCLKKPELGIKLSMATLIWGCVYLALGQASQTWAEHKALKHLQEQNIAVSRIKTMSTPLNNILWQILIEDRSGNRYEMFSHSLDGSTPEYRLISRASDTLSTPIPNDPDIERLKWFTDDWIQLIEQNNQLVLQDLRMSFAGRYFFSFIIAEKQKDETGKEQWRLITPIRSNAKNNYEFKKALNMLWLRLYHKTPMDYAQWNKNETFQK